jgi:hypothetical protein
MSTTGCVDRIGRKFVFRMTCNSTGGRVEEGDAREGARGGGGRRCSRKFGRGGDKILGKTAAPAVHRNIANGVTLRPKESPMIATRTKTAYQHL